MFVLKYSSYDFEQQLKEIAESVTHHHYGRKVVLKDEIGTGYYKILKFPDGLKAVITNYVINQEFSGEREQVKEDYYLLHINQVKTGIDFRVAINNREVAFDDTIYNSVFLTDSKEAFGLKGSKGACFSQLKVVIPKGWFSSGFPGLFDETLFRRYFLMGEQRLHLDFYDAGYRNLVDTVMNIEDNENYLPAAQRIITSIIERFLGRIRSRLQEKEEDPGLTGNMVARNDPAPENSNCG
jgi:hypothetical protein